MMIADTYAYLVKRAESYQERGMIGAADLLFDEADLLAAEMRQESDEVQAMLRDERLAYEGAARMLER